MWAVATILPLFILVSGFNVWAIALVPVCVKSELFQDEYCASILRVLASATCRNVHFSTARVI
ncbi:MAG: hypothetical protein WBA57_19320 [Elainellaceae cyanobacterium]